MRQFTDSPESSHFQEDDEIDGITMGMIQKDVSWYNNQSAQTIRNLENLQSHLIIKELREVSILESYET